MKISFSPSSVPHWLSLLLLMAISCGKEIVKPTGNNKVVITVTNASDISYTTATLNSELTNVSGNTSISQHGHCWSTQSSPDISGTHTSLGALATGKTFNSGLTDLLSGTLYYVRPYIIMNTKVVYGNNISFTTTPTSHPTLTTLAVTNITRITAESGGNISSDGGSAVIARGVCWGTSVNPSLIGNHTSVGTGTGLFVSTLIGLSPATTYYIKAYATNSVGTAYGDQLDFITTSSASIPVVTTTSVTGITVSTATSGGNVTSSGGASVTAKGICWSINQTPSISDTHTTDGSGTGVFLSNITGLSAATTYYVRAFATNSAGTAYGNEVSFNTIGWSCGSSITINHIAGSIAPVTKTVTYNTVTNIPGETSKCWITSNLGADHQATAVNDTTEPAAGWYWQFNRKQGYKHDGATRTPNTTWIITINENLDWQPVNDPCLIELGNGWRMPMKTEWLNVDATGNWTSWAGPWNSGLKLHSAGYLNYSNGSISSRGADGDYWSSMNETAPNGWREGFYFGNSAVSPANKAFGYSLRCIKD